MLAAQSVLSGHFRPGYDPDPSACTLDPLRLDSDIEWCEANYSRSKEHFHERHLKNARQVVAGLEEWEQGVEIGAVDAVCEGKDLLVVGRGTAVRSEPLARFPQGLPTVPFLAVPTPVADSSRRRRARPPSLRAQVALR